MTIYDEIHSGLFSGIKNSLSVNLLTFGMLCIILIEVYLSILLVALPAYVFFLLLVYFMISLLIVRDFRFGVYLLAFLVPLAADHIGFHIISRWNVRVADIVPVYVLISSVTLLSYFLHKFSRLHVSNSKEPVSRIMFLLVVWSAVSLLWSFNFRHNLFQFFIILSNYVLLFLLVKSIDSKKSHKILINCWIAFGTVAALLTYLSSSTVAKSIYSIKILDWLVFKLYLLAPPIRAESIANTNETALILNLTACITIGLMLIAENPMKKFLFALLALFMMYGVVLTLSKGGLGGLVLMVYFIIFSVDRLRKKFFKNFILASLIIVFLLAVQILTTSESKAPRLVSDSQTSSLKTRIDVMYEPGIKKLMEGNILQGMSVGTSKAYLDAKNGGCPHGHSIYFSTLFDLGVIGVFIATSALFVLLGNILKLRKREQTDLHVLSLCGCGGLAAIMIHGMIDFEYNTPEIWFFLGIVVSSLNLMRRELA